jgi:hypothetical protein
LECRFLRDLIGDGFDGGTLVISFCLASLFGSHFFLPLKQTPVASMNLKSKRENVTAAGSSLEQL